MNIVELLWSLSCLVSTDFLLTLYVLLGAEVFRQAQDVVRNFVLFPLPRILSCKQNPVEPIKGGRRVGLWWFWAQQMTQLSQGHFLVQISTLRETHLEARPRLGGTHCGLASVSHWWCFQTDGRMDGFVCWLWRVIGDAIWWAVDRL